MKSTRHKANISNPKVNRGCTQLTADCVQISLGPSIPYIPLGVYHTGRFNAMIYTSPWRISIMLSSNGNIFRVTFAICAGNSPVPGEFPAKGQWRGALMFSLIYAWINGWVNNAEAGDLRNHRAHYDVTVMFNVIVMFNMMRCTNNDRRL